MDDDLWFMKSGNNNSINNLILKKRDQNTIQKIKEVFEENKAKHIKAGILYGVGHMNTLITFLMNELGYVPYDSKFLTVFSLHG